MARLEQTFDIGRRRAAFRGVNAAAAQCLNSQLDDTHIYKNQGCQYAMAAPNGENIWVKPQTVARPPETKLATAMKVRFRIIPVSYVDAPTL